VLNHYKTIVVADVHLGTEGKSLKKLIYFLKKNSCDRLVLNGDIIKGWQLRKIKRLHKKHANFLNTLFKLIEKYGTEIIFLTGSKEFIEDKKNLKFGKISFQNELMLTSGKYKYYIINEEVVNKYILRNWAAHIQAIPYILAVWINRQYNLFRFHKGKSYYSLLKENKLYKAIEELFLKYSREYVTDLINNKDCDGIISGQIHKPCIFQLGEVSYFNAGYWSESHIALVENLHGEWKLLSYSETLEADKEAKKHYKIQKKLFEKENMESRMAAY
jgi:UDP-2,3-diacylglucosamine pyrophosphatase LpxH